MRIGSFVPRLWVVELQERWLPVLGQAEERGLQEAVWQTDHDFPK